VTVSVTVTVVTVCGTVLWSLGDKLEHCLTRRLQVVTVAAHNCETRDKL